MKKETTVEFVITKSNHVQIECEVNYVSGIFLVDTGASNSCINYLSASKFNLEFKKSNEIASSATNKINETYHSKKGLHIFLDPSTAFVRQIYQLQPQLQPQS